MYASSLRKHSLWQMLNPQLSSNVDFKFTECNRDDFDIAVPLPSAQELHVWIILSHEVEKEINRLQHLLNSSVAKLKLIILVAETEREMPSSAMAYLQIRLLEMKDSTPVVLVPEPVQIIRFLKLYVEELRVARLPELKMKPDLHTLVSFATSTAPNGRLTNKEAETVLRLVGSVTKLEAVTNSEEGQEWLSQHLTATTVRKLIEFWEDEWLV